MKYYLDLDPHELASLPHHELVARAEAKAIYDLRKSKEDCEESLSEFIKQAWHVIEPSQPYTHNWHVDFISHHLEAITNGDINRLLINVPPGTMKALDSDTPILTIEGWKRHGDLTPGDFVFAPNGKPIRVIACTQEVLENSYCVKFDDSSEIVAGSGHEWIVERYYDGLWRDEIVTTPELISVNESHNPDCIPFCRPLQFPNPTNNENPPYDMACCSLNSKDRYHFVASVTPVGKRVVKCIQVEGGIYLAGHTLIATHNSLLVNVFWPSWEWTLAPSTRYICTAHSQSLAIRDSIKMRRLITSPWYQERWGKLVTLTSDQAAKTKFENTATGFREAVAFESMTGVRGDRVTIDDPHSVDSAMSDVQRETTVTTFLEAVPTRLTNPDSSAIVVIMQRLHEADVSGTILEKDLGYTHIMLPMEFDETRRCTTSLGWSDPREKEGELLFEARFPRNVVERDKAVMGPWAVAGQFQQSPSPRGGGIIKREWWCLYDDEMAQSQGISSANKYPVMDYIVASLDPAYTEKKENDPSALTVWGVWQRGGQSARRILGRNGDVADILDDRDTIPSLMLMTAWEKRLPIHGPDVERMPGETDSQFRIRQRESMGLVEWVIETCNRFNVDTLLIESKANGISVAQEIKRLNRTNTWGVELINPGSLDKVARAYAIQPIFSNGTVYAPDRDWADKVITQSENFPKVAHDDLVDSMTQALKFLRERNLIRRPEEIVSSIRNEGMWRPSQRPIYDV